MHLPATVASSTLPSFSLQSVQPALEQLHFPKRDSHKGENGKVLIIGGSDLFHAASQWSFRVASRLVDMTFYSSVAENNRLLHDAKLFGQDGVIVPRSQLRSYLEEAEVVLIGPGMRRDFLSRYSGTQLDTLAWDDITEAEWEADTTAVVSVLLRSFPNKKWVLDAGALQVLKPQWIPMGAVLTPHPAELQRLLLSAAHSLDTEGESSNYEADGTNRLIRTLAKLTQPLPHRLRDTMHGASDAPEVLLPGELHAITAPGELDTIKNLAQAWKNSTWIVKGPTDILWNPEEVRAVSGGNAGMTKGGTGDALAGLIAGLWTRGDLPHALEAVTVASWLNKAAGHALYEQHADMFNTSDLVEMLPVVWRALSPGL